MGKRFVLHLSVWLALFAGVCAQQVCGQKVALVLSGGGSRGLAHVGVLKALEENGIPIDYIAGTSMGAIIGGLYASGYTPDQIYQFVTSPDFESWAAGELSEDYIFYFKRPDPNASWISLKFDYDDVKKKLQTKLPTNLISPFQMDFAIMELYASASAACDYNFDSLFVPFRCVASDIDSNKSVVLKNGQLGSAIRASSTYPFYFKPIVLNGKVLFDGGMYNNFPVDVAISAFHPDIIIGSKAASNYRDASHDDIISQVQNMIIKETNYKVPAENGVMIEPTMPHVNVIDFSQKEEFIDSGYVAAMRMMDQIKKKVKRRVTSRELFEKRETFVQKKPVVIIDTINVQGLKKNQAEYIQRFFTKKSRYITLNTLKPEYFKLLADNKIKYIYPTLKYEKSTGFYELNLQVQQAEHFMAEFGGNISSSSANAAYVGIEYRWFQRIGLTFAANGYFGRFYSSADLEARVDFSSNFPVYLTTDFTYNHKDYFRNTTYFFEDKTPSFLVQNENHFGLNAGIPATNKGKVAFGAAAGIAKDEYYQTNQFTRQDTADITYFNFFIPHITFDLNSLNYKQFPDAGLRFYISLRMINGKEKSIPGSTSDLMQKNYIKYHNWFQVRIIYDNYFKSIGPLKLGFYGELLLSDQDIFNNYTSTILRTPAFTPIPEMQTLFLPNYRAINYASVGIKGVLKLYKQLNLRLEGYLFQPYKEFEQGPDKQAVFKKQFSDRSFVYSTSIVYHSIIGPVSFSFNYYDRAVNNTSFLFNIGYIIFNKSVFD